MRFRAPRYSCQEENPSGTEATPTTAMAAYESAATMIAGTRILPDCFTGKRKCAVSKHVISKPTKAQGARMTRLKIAYPRPTGPLPKVVRAPFCRAEGKQKTAMTAIPVASTTASTVRIL